jgi:hypothetical protein
MKAITKKQWRTAPNGWGQDSTRAKLFEIEPSDVGVKRENWRGHRHSHTFTRSDVGRQIAVYTDNSSWTYWVFNTTVRKAADNVREGMNALRNSDKPNRRVSRAY